jgi:hypothetical protein
VYGACRAVEGAADVLMIRWFGVNPHGVPAIEDGA